MQYIKLLICFMGNICEVKAVDEYADELQTDSKRNFTFDYKTDVRRNLLIGIKFVDC